MPRSAKRSTLPVLLLLSACSVAPELQLPDVEVAQAYKEMGPWVTAAPADSLTRDAWWQQFGDPELDRLQSQLIAGSPDLAAVLARYDQARAFAQQLRSQLFPSLVLRGDGGRARQSETRPPTGIGLPRHYDAYSISVEAQYEVDLWGRVRNTVRAGNLEAKAAEADLESARLSLQAELADLYIALRGLDREAVLLADTVSAYDRALSLTRERHEAGIVSGLDVARARTQLESARSQSSQTQAQRSLIEHAIAALLGASPSAFSLPSRAQTFALPAVPDDVPATLLQRRPDIAAAQRRTAAANARVGVARAAFFPAISLSGTYGFESTASHEWLTAPNAFWSIGPVLALELFDANRRRAVVTQVRAELDEAGAAYRSVVLNAFREVEDNLALVHYYGAAGQSEQAALTSASEALDLAMNRYREGAVSYLEVTQSQTTALATQREALDLETRRLRASVALVRALGGGWSS
ncbi:MAG: efflux transporter outer membrane subunit [Steroidobacteraceae bacterium]